MDGAKRAEFRNMPSAARVYPAGEPERWIVESPLFNGAREMQTFSGPRAQVMALEFAYRSYGKARFFPR